MAKHNDKLEHRSSQVKSDNSEKTPEQTRQFKVRKSHYDYQCTSSYRWKHPKLTPVPWLNLKGYWLEQAGFSVNAKIHASIKPGEITLTVVEKGKSEPWGWY